MASFSSSTLDVAAPNQRPNSIPTFPDAAIAIPTCITDTTGYCVSFRAQLDGFNRVIRQAIDEGELETSIQSDLLPGVLDIAEAYLPDWRFRKHSCMNRYEIHHIFHPLVQRQEQHVLQGRLTALKTKKEEYDRSLAAVTKNKVSDATEKADTTPMTQVD